MASDLGTRSNCSCHRLLVFGALWLFASSPALGATFTEVDNEAGNRYSLVIEGRIISGDYERLAAILKRRELFPDAVFIESPGGNVGAAMAMGRVLRAGLIDIWPSPTECNSACAMIAFASMTNIPGGRVGLHRPSYEPEEFARLSFLQARERTRELDNAVRAYLKEMNVPDDLIEKMMATPSNEIVYLNMRDYRARVGRRPPVVYEWLLARCGAFTPDKAISTVTEISACENRAIEAERRGVLQTLPSPKNIFSDIVGPK